MKLEIEIPSILYQEARDNRGYISVGKMEIAWKAIADGKPIEQEPFKPMVEIDLYSVIKQKYIERELLDKMRAEIIKYEGDCRLSVDEYPSCKQCTDSVFETIYGILDKYKAESEVEE